VIVDTSALVAILRGESEAADFEAKLELAGSNPAQLR